MVKRTSVPRRLLSEDGLTTPTSDTLARIRNGEMTPQRMRVIYTRQHSASSSAIASVMPANIPDDTKIVPLSNSWQLRHQVSLTLGLASCGVTTVVLVAVVVVLFLVHRKQRLCDDEKGGIDRQPSEAAQAQDLASSPMASTGQPSCLRNFFKTGRLKQSLSRTDLSARPSHHSGEKAVSSPTPAYFSPSMIQRSAQVVQVGWHAYPSKHSRAKNAKAKRQRGHGHMSPSSHSVFAEASTVCSAATPVFQLAPLTMYSENIESPSSPPIAQDLSLGLGISVEGSMSPIDDKGGPLKRIDITASMFAGSYSAAADGSPVVSATHVRISSISASLKISSTTAGGIDCLTNRSAAFSAYEGPSGSLQSDLSVSSLSTSYSEHHVGCCSLEESSQSSFTTLATATSHDWLNVTCLESKSVSTLPAHFAQPQVRIVTTPPVLRELHRPVLPLTCDTIQRGLMWSSLPDGPLCSGTPLQLRHSAEVLSAISASSSENPLSGARCAVVASGSGPLRASAPTTSEPRTDRFSVEPQAVFSELAGVVHDNEAHHDVVDRALRSIHVLMTSPSLPSDQVGARSAGRFASWARRSRCASEGRSVRIDHDNNHAPRSRTQSARASLSRSPRVSSCTSRRRLVQMRQRGCGVMSSPAQNQQATPRVTKLAIDCAESKPDDRLLPSASISSAAGIALPSDKEPDQLNIKIQTNARAQDEGGPDMREAALALQAFFGRQIEGSKVETSAPDRADSSIATLAHLATRHGRSSAVQPSYLSRHQYGSPRSATLPDSRRRCIPVSGGRMRCPPTERQAGQQGSAQVSPTRVPSEHLPALTARISDYMSPTMQVFRFYEASD